MAWANLGTIDISVILTFGLGSGHDLVCSYVLLKIPRQRTSAQVLQNLAICSLFFVVYTYHDEEEWMCSVQLA